jgi:hypothetical protein
LLADPKATLASVGLDVPEGITVDIIEAGYNRLLIVLPPVQSGELSDEALAGKVGGSAQAVSGSEFITTSSAPEPGVAGNVVRSGAGGPATLELEHLG